MSKKEVDVPLGGCLFGLLMLTFGALALIWLVVRVIRHAWGA